MEFLTERQSAAYLSISPSCFRGLITAGALQPYRPSIGVIRFSKGMLDAYMIGTLEHRKNES